MVLTDCYIDLLYCHEGLMKLIERQRWQMALSFAGNDASLQKLLLDHMLAAGELQWAARLAQILGITDFEAQVSQVVAQRGSLRTTGLSHSANAAALNGCLALELSGGGIVFCDTEESVRRAMAHFFPGSEACAGSSRDHVVGLDVEWKPTSSKIAAATGSTTTTAVASILQISSSSRVFLIDLLALHVRSVCRQKLFCLGLTLHAICSRTTRSCSTLSLDACLPVRPFSRLASASTQT
jgi:hypothetical protein